MTQPMGSNVATAGNASRCSCYDATSDARIDPLSSPAKKDCLVTVSRHPMWATVINPVVKRRHGWSANRDYALLCTLT
jgi:hypothetical protein